MRRETVLALEQLGIHVEYTHHEVGPSQHEVDMRYADALKMADDCMTYRITVKEYAMKYGWHATFMPKPLFGENGSGMHTHMSLFKDGRNAFFDADDPYFLSDIGKAFIAGQLRHAREMSAIFAQWVNSYKRLVPGYEAPVYVAWSRRNRSALVRVPLYHPGKEQATRMELRCPDPACNPYLTFAVLLQAGLEGIEKGYELPEPMEKNLYHLAAGRAAAAGHRAAARDARRGDRADGRQSSSCCARSASTRSTATSRSSARSGRTTACRSRSGSSTATCRCSDQRRRNVLKTVVAARQPRRGVRVVAALEVDLHRPLPGGNARSGDAGRLARERSARRRPARRSGSWRTSCPPWRKCPKIGLPGFWNSPLNFHVRLAFGLLKPVEVEKTAFATFTSTAADVFVVESVAVIVKRLVAGLIVPSSGAFTVAENAPSGPALPERAICSPASAIGACAPKPPPESCMALSAT